jgi:hypothetical protein
VTNSLHSHIGDCFPSCDQIHIEKSDKILENRDYMHKIELSILENAVLNFRNDPVVGNSHEFVEMIPSFSKSERLSLIYLPHLNQPLQIFFDWLSLDRGSIKTISPSRTGTK